MIFQTEKHLKELGDKLSADKKAPIAAALEKLRAAHKEQNIEAIDAATEELNTAFHAASSEMYANAGGAESGPDMSGAQPNANNSSQGGADITDADFEEVK